MKYSVLYSILLAFIFLNSYGIKAQSDTSKVSELVKSAVDRKNSLEESAKLIDEAISVAEKNNFLKIEADALSFKGGICLRMGEYQAALEAFWKELKLRENNPVWENSSAGHVYAMIGESYRAIGSFDLSEEYLNKSLQLAEKNRNESEIAYAYNRLAAVYHEVSYRRPDSSYSYKAIDFANKSLAIYKKMENTDNIINNYNIIGAANNFLGRYDESLKYLFAALDYTGKDSTYPDKANILNNIASVYNFKKDYDNAIRYSLQSYDISKKSGIKIYIVGAARQLTTAYAGKGDYKNAFNYLEEAANLNTLLFDDRKTSAIYALQKKHEVELSTREEELRNVRIKIIGTAVIIVILITGIGLYLRHRKLIDVYNELERNSELILSQKEELSKTNADKDKFISILSHDIRNPLNGILGFTGILEKDYDKIEEKEKKEFIGYLNTSANSLYVLVDRVLLWSRVQRGSFVIRKEKINLKEIVCVADGLQKANAIKKGILLENKMTEDIYTESDRNVLDTVIRNLVDNAVKFTKAGGKICIYHEINGDKVMVNVTDTGVGIEKDDIDKIFGIEQKIQTKGTANEEGTGLGLTLCKDMLKLAGSNLKVESEAGKGSRFYFELPLVS
jgi:signal transduction histidine kinase